MEKVLKAILVILILIALILSGILAYFLIAEIETKMPEQIKEELNIEIEEKYGRNVYIIEPENREEIENVIIYFHGGSYIAEANQNHWDFIQKVAIDTNSVVVFPDYPLAPKYTYKDVEEMAVGIYESVVEELTKWGNEVELIVMGDSAGGGIALALSQTIEKTEIKHPDKTILISPWLDTKLDNPKIVEVQVIDTQLNSELLKIAGVLYSRNDESSEWVNPIEGDILGIDDIIIFSGTNDILYPDVEELKVKSDEIGADVTVNTYNGAKHIWIIDKNSEEELVNKGYTDLINSI